MSLENDMRVLGQLAMLSDFSEDKLRLLAFSSENRALRDGQPPVEIGDQGRMIGEMALLTESERPYTAIARGDTMVIQIRRPLFRRMLDEFPDIAARLQQRIAASLVETTTALRVVKERLDRIDE